MTSTFDAKPRWFRFFRSIEGKLILLLIVLIIPTLLIEAYIYNERFESRRTEELQANLEIARAVAMAFHEYVQDVLHQELAIGLMLASHGLSPEERDGYIDKNKAEYPSFLNLMWVDPHGVVLSSYLRQFTGMNIGAREYFQLIRAGRSRGVSDLHLSEGTPEHVFAISRAILDERGDLLGVVVAVTQQDELDDILGGKRSKGAGIGILDRGGRPVFSFPVTDYIWERQDWLSDYPEIKDVFESKEIVAVIGSEKYGKKQLAAFAPISSIGWAAAACRGEDSAMAAIRASLLPGTIMFLMITIASFGIALVFSRNIAASIERLRDHALALGRGQTRSPAALSGTAELDDLADAFNKMTEDMQLRERERDQSELALRQSEEHFRLTFDQSPIGVTLTGLDRKLKRVNAAYCQMMGYSEAELLNLCFTDITHPDDLEANVALQDKLVAGEIEHFQMEKRYIRKNGPIIWVSISVRMVRDVEGSPLYCMALAEDITERKRMEHALRDSERDLNRAQFVAKTGSWRLDMVNDELIWSEETYRIFGIRKGTPLTYEAFLDLIHPADRDYVEKKWLAALLGDGYDIEHRILAGDRVAWVRERAELEFDAKGRLQGGFGTVQDITGRKRMEEELRKAHDELELRVQERTAELEKANDELRLIPPKLIAVQEEERRRLASELHDSIGQTLAALKFWVEMVLRLRDSGDGVAAFNHLEQFVPILQRSIEETRSIYMGLRLSMLDSMGLLATLDWLRREYMRFYPERHIELETGVEEEEIPESLKVNIFRIVQEALNNVAKHSQAKWVDIVLSRSGGGIELVVCDEGVGMNLDQILRSSTARSLGLTSMRERAELSGGSLSMESAPGEGTTIRVRWPATVVHLA